MEWRADGEGKPLLRELRATDLLERVQCGKGVSRVLRRIAQRRAGEPTALQPMPAIKGRGQSLVTFHPQWRLEVRALLAASLHLGQGAGCSGARTQAQAREDGLAGRLLLFLSILSQTDGLEKQGQRQVVMC